MTTPARDSLRLLPLGGLGEIGMNCLALEQEDGVMVVDCGTSFPHDDLGVDVLHPDFRWLERNASRVRGVFLTHGHEDHIGALPYLLSRLEVPVFGPPHALGLVKRRLAEHDFEEGEVDLREVRPGRCYEVGPFRVEPVRVAHSIVEASALAIETAAGLVVHTGDFNFDPDPPDGEPTDEERLTALGDQGVALLLSDSTNVDVPSPGVGERAVGRTLEALIAGAPHRVFLGLFASNVQRLMLLGEMAARLGRKVCLLGRSMGTHVEVAQAVRRLSWRSDLLVSPEQARALPRRELLVLAGGTQAERNSALRRLASGEHQDLRVEAGDLVVLSSRAIPGNEREVFEMACDFLRQGASVHTRSSDPGVHTSGHATRAEQTRMLELTRPSAFLPVHGTLHHLLRHRELARSLGVRETQVVENGQSVRLQGGRLTLDERFHAGKVAIAQGGEPLAEELLRARAELGRAGVAIVTLLLDRRGRPLLPPRALTRGVAGADDDSSVLRALEREAARAVERAQRRGFRVEEEVRRAMRRVLLSETGTRPTLEVQVLEARDA